MALCSNPKGRAAAKGKCPPLKVAREFVRADNPVEVNTPLNRARKKSSYVT